MRAGIDISRGWAMVALSGNGQGTRGSYRSKPLVEVSSMLEDKMWASGNWHLTRGKNAEFVQRWVEFLTWTKEANNGFLAARLLGDSNDPDHFVSFASWRDAESMAAWKQRPEFAERFGNCRALCEDMQGGNFETVGAI